MHEVDILRTKGNLNQRFKKMQIIWKNSSLAGKVRIKEFNPRVEVLSPDTTRTTK